MITIRPFTRASHRPGSIGRCVAMMSRFYADQLGLGLEFEVETAVALADFASGLDGGRDALWLATDAEGEVVGCAAVDGRAPGDAAAALFRWFYLAPACRGHGVGRRMLRHAIAFARAVRFDRMQLHTHASLSAAVHLYESEGFRRTGSAVGVHWGRQLQILDYELALWPQRQWPTPTLGRLAA